MTYLKKTLVEIINLHRVLNPARIRLAHSEAIENLSSALDACATERGGLDKTNRFYVYVYLDPRESGIFEYICPSGMRVTFDHKPIYIGKGQGKRINDHTFDCDLSAKTQKSNVLKKMISSGTPPIKLKIVDQCSEAIAFAHEIDLIAGIGRLKNGEGSLLNITVGGEGVVGLKFSEESRARMREAQRRRFDAETPEQKKIRAAKAKVTKAANPEVEAKRRRKIADHNSREDVRAAKALSARKQHESMTDEDRSRRSEKKSKTIRDKLNSLPPGDLLALKQAASERMSSRWANMSEADKEEMARKRESGKGIDYKHRQSESLKKTLAAKTPEEKAAALKKSWETRRKNALSKKLEEITNV